MAGGTKASGAVTGEAGMTAEPVAAPARGAAFAVARQMVQRTRRRRTRLRVLGLLLAVVVLAFCLGSADARAGTYSVYADCNSNHSWTPSAGPTGYLPAYTDCNAADIPGGMKMYASPQNHSDRVNRNGDFIEAYAVGAEGDVTLHAVSIEEENEVYEYGSPDELGPRYRARGTNRYKRRRLEDSVFAGTPETADTVVTPGRAAHVGAGQYRTSMRMAARPQNNVVAFDSEHRPPVVRYVREFRSVSASDLFRVNPGTVGGGVAEQHEGPDDRGPARDDVGREVRLVAHPVAHVNLLKCPARRRTP